MTREDFAKNIRWAMIIWLAGLANVGAMLPQLIKILTSKNVQGLSVTMFWMYMGIQVAFMFDGYFKNNKVLLWCMGASALVSVATIASIYCYR